MLKFCVLGEGIKYTLSPLLHGAVFAELGVNAEYTVRDVDETRFDECMKELVSDFDGFNVTKPYKRAVLGYLAEKRAEIDAVNTVINDGGRLIGYNTDIYGFGLAFDGLCGDVRGEKVLVIGAGGAAEAVLCALKNRGADVTVVNRTFSRGRELAEKYGMKAAETSIGLRPSVIVNCATVGNDGVSSPLSGREDLGDLKYAYDLVYSPAHTQFMKDCEKAGAKTSNGLSMLIYQAVVADEIFLGLDGADRKRLFAAAESAVKKELEK